MKIVITFALFVLANTAQAQTALTFGPAPGSPFAAGNGPYALATCDFNGDGTTDIAVANSVSGTLGVYLGNGSGGFTAAKGSPYMVGPNSIAVADFNGDGISDLAATSAVGNVAVLLGDGKGGFSPVTGSPFAAGTNPVRVAAGDLNGDGVPDLVIANQGSNNLSILLGNGKGGFTAAANSPFPVGTQPFSVVIGDFNGDGAPDLATANTGSGDVTVLLGNHAGGFTPASGSPIASGGEPGGIVAADFNKDGQLDLAISNAGSSSNNVTVLLGDGTGKFSKAPQSPFAVGTSPIALALGDFNNDGIPDLVTVNTGGGNATLLVGDGKGGFAAAGPFAVGTEPFFAVVADFNGDGKADFATANFASNNVSVLLNTSAIGSAPPAINANGVVPVYSTSTTLQSGEWASIYGSNLAAQTATWNGDFPTKLGGTTVTVDGKPAYLWVVTPGQINFQVPDDSNTGLVAVVVTTAAGSASATVTLGAYAPAFLLLSAKYPTAIVLTTGPGNTGAGYDIIGPAGAFSYPARPVNPGETVILYGVGFGPTTPSFRAGQLVTGSGQSVTYPQITIGGVPAQVNFAGIVEAGLFQFNVVVPNAPSGDQPLVASVGGQTTQSNIYLTVQ